MLNREAPQSRHTNTTGNISTPGLSGCLGPEKWIIISVVYSATFSDEHCAQHIRHTPLLLTFYATGLTDLPPVVLKIKGTSRRASPQPGASFLACSSGVLRARTSGLPTHPGPDHESQESSDAGDDLEAFCGDGGEPELRLHSPLSSFVP
jgi:hypothetical protein